jgi:hypothetical protein
MQGPIVVMQALPGRALAVEIERRRPRQQASWLSVTRCGARRSVPPLTGAVSRPRNFIP